MFITEERLRTILTHPIADYLRIVVGATLIAAALHLFMIPNQVVAGGLTGLSILLHYQFHAPVSLMLLLVNLPVLWLGYRYCGGKNFLWRTGAGLASLALATSILGQVLQSPTDDRLLVIFYGGLLEGVGLALVFRGRGTTGGADVLGRIAYRLFNINVGQTMLGINVLVYGWAGLKFGLEPVMVAFALAFITTRTLDTLLTGFAATRAVMIISIRHEQIKTDILEQLHRGVTVLHGSGGYTGEPRPVLYVVVPRSELPRLRRQILAVDPAAFMAVTAAQDLLGGFALQRALQ